MYQNIRFAALWPAGRRLRVFKSMTDVMNVSEIMLERSIHEVLSVLEIRLTAGKLISRDNISA